MVRRIISILAIIATLFCVLPTITHSGTPASLGYPWAPYSNTGGIQFGPTGKKYIGSKNDGSSGETIGFVNDWFGNPSESLLWNSDGSFTFLTPVNVAGFTNYTFATLPTTCLDGQLVRLTDNIRGVWTCLSNKWFSITNSADIRDFGAINDGIILNDAVTTTTSKTLTSPSGTWSISDIGKSLLVVLAGGSPTTLTDCNTYSPVATQDGLVNAVAIAADNTLTSTSAAWVIGDVGKTIMVGGAGVAGANLVTTIASINSLTSIEMTVAASTSVNPASVWTAHSDTLYCPSGSVVAGDIGKYATVQGAGPSGVPLTGTINSRITNYWFTINTPASTVVSNTTTRYGMTDLVTTIASVNNNTSINMADASTNTLTTQASYGSDNTTLIQSAFTVSNKVFIPTGTYLVSNLTISNDNTEIYGKGLSSLLLSKAGSTGALIDAGLHPVSFHDFSLYGGNNTPRLDSPISDSGQDGIWITPHTQSYINHISVIGFGGSGLRTKGIGRYRTPGLQVSNSVFESNWTGIFSEDNFAEYTLWTSNDCTYNRYGVRFGSGNMNFNAMKLSDNGYGVWVNGVGIVNNGHSNFSNSLINHSSVYSLYIDNVTFGMVFAGNQIHIGSIYIKNSTGVQILSGELNVQGYYLEQGGRNVIRGNFIDADDIDSGNLVHHNYNFAQDDTVFLDNVNGMGQFIESGHTLTNEYKNSGQGNAGQFYDVFNGTAINKGDWFIRGTWSQNGSLTSAGTGSGTGTTPWTTTIATATRSFDRTPTLTFATDITIGNANDMVAFGTTTRANPGGYFVYSFSPHLILIQPLAAASRIYIFENGANYGVKGAALTPGLTYRFKIVCGPTQGAYYYVSGDVGLTWTLLYDGTVNARTETPLRAIFAVHTNTTSTFDNITVSTGSGWNGQTPKGAYSIGVVAPAGGVGIAAGGWSSAVDRDTSIALINKMRDALIKAGLFIP